MSTILDSGTFQWLLALLGIALANGLFVMQTIPEYNSFNLLAFLYHEITIIGFMLILLSISQLSIRR